MLIGGYYDKLKNIMFGKVLRINKYNKNWFALLSLRGVVIMLLFFSALSFSQVRISNTDYFRYRINGEVEKTFKGTDKFTEIMNEGINYKLNNPDSIILIEEIKYVHYWIEDIYNSMKIIDTLIISGGWHLTGENGNYFRLPNCGDIIKIEADTVFKWQKDIEVIRTKIFGKTALKLTDSIPFQFKGFEITKIDSTKVNFTTYATEKHCVKYYKDNIFYKEFIINCEPIKSDKGWASKYYADGLKPNTTYLIRVEGNDKKENINFIEFQINTLVEQGN